MQDNALLIRRAQKGDADAFEALVAPMEQKLYALCLRMLGNREDARDCLQEAMLRLWRSIASYRKQSSFQTWSYRIATNVCLDLLRKQKVRPSVSLDVLSDLGFSPIEASADPQARVEESARRAALSSGVAELPADLRTALVLRDMQGFSYEEVSQITDTPLGTVKSRISRAREKLRGHLSMDAELFGEPSVYHAERRKDV